MPEDSAIDKMLKKRHLEYADAAPEWVFLRQAMDGGPAFAKAGNLYKHALENSKIYADRVIRAADHYLNLSKLVKDAYEGYIFQTALTVKADAPACLVEFAKEAGQEKESLEDLAKEVHHWLVTYGCLWIATDKPKADADRVLSKAEEDAEGLKAYAYIIHPQNVLSAKRSAGAIKWAIVREDGVEDDTPESSGEKTVQYRVWEEELVRVYIPVTRNGLDTFELKEEFPNPLGKVPLTYLSFSEGSSFVSPGPLNDIAHLARAIFNKDSLLDEIHYKATFPQLAIPYDGTLWQTNADGVDALTGEGQAILKMGVQEFIPFSSTAGSPLYLNYPDGPAKELRDAIREMILSALTEAFLDGEAAVEGQKVVGSGVSKSYSFQKLNKRLASIASVLQGAFTSVAGFVLLWNGESADNLETPIEFPDNFEVKTLTQEVSDMIELLNSGIKSAKLSEISYKKVVRIAHPNLDPKDLDIIDAEILEAVKAEEDFQAITADANAATQQGIIDGVQMVKDDVKGNINASKLANRAGGAGQTSL